MSKPPTRGCRPRPTKRPPRSSPQISAGGCDRAAPPPDVRSTYDGCGPCRVFQDRNRQAICRGGSVAGPGLGRPCRRQNHVSGRDQGLYRAHQNVRWPLACGHRHSTRRPRPGRGTASSTASIRLSTTPVTTAARVRSPGAGCSAPATRSTRSPSPGRAVASAPATTRASTSSALPAARSRRATSRPSTPTRSPARSIMTCPLR